MGSCRFNEFLARKPSKNGSFGNFATDCFAARAMTVLNEFPNAHHHAGVHRFMVIIEGNRVLDIPQRKP